MLMGYIIEACLFTITSRSNTSWIFENHLKSKAETVFFYDSQVKEFFTKNLQGENLRSVSQALDRIEMNIDWTTRNEAVVIEWLKGAADQLKEAAQRDSWSAERDSWSAGTGSWSAGKEAAEGGNWSAERGSWSAERGSSSAEKEAAHQLAGREWKNIMSLNVWVIKESYWVHIFLTCSVNIVWTNWIST